MGELDDGARAGAEVDGVGLRFEVHALAHAPQLLLGVVGDAEGVDGLHVVGRCPAGDEQVRDAQRDQVGVLVVDKLGVADLAVELAPDHAAEAESGARIVAEHFAVHVAIERFLGVAVVHQQVEEGLAAQGDESVDHRAGDRLLGQALGFDDQGADVGAGLVELHRLGLLGDVERIVDVEQGRPGRVQDETLDRAHAVVGDGGGEVATHAVELVLHHALDHLFLGLGAERADILHLVGVDAATGGQVDRGEGLAVAGAFVDRVGVGAARGGRDQLQAVAFALDPGGRRADAALALQEQSVDHGRDGLAFGHMVDRGSQAGDAEGVAVENIESGHVGAPQRTMM